MSARDYFRGAKWWAKTPVTRQQEGAGNGRAFLRSVATAEVGSGEVSDEASAIELLRRKAVEHDALGMGSIEEMLRSRAAEAGESEEAKSAVTQMNLPGLRAVYRGEGDMPEFSLAGVPFPKGSPFEGRFARILVDSAKCATKPGYRFPKEDIPAGTIGDLVVEVPQGVQPWRYEADLGLDAETRAALKFLKPDKRAQFLALLGVDVQVSLKLTAAFVSFAGHEAVPITKAEEKSEKDNSIKAKVDKLLLGEE